MERPTLNDAAEATAESSKRSSLLACLTGPWARANVGDMDVSIYIYMYVYVYIYMYICIDTDTDIDIDVDIGILGGLRDLVTTGKWAYNQAYL